MGCPVLCKAFLGLLSQASPGHVPAVLRFRILKEQQGKATDGQLRRRNCWTTGARCFPLDQNLVETAK